MSVTMQKYVVAFLSLALLVTLLAAGVVDGRRQGEARRHAEAALNDVANPALARGRAVYAKYSCNACHNDAGAGGLRNQNAEGGGKVNSLQHVFETYTPAELAEKVRAGVPVVAKADPTGPEPPLHMPAYRDLISGPELNDLVAYLMSLRPARGKKGSEW